MRYFVPVLLLSYCAAQTLSPALPIQKLAVDSAGNIYAAQSSSITKLNQWTVTVPFPVLALNVMPGGLMAAGAGSILQMDAGSGTILSSASFTVLPGTTPQYMAITPAGNIVLSGVVSSAPATPGALNIPREQAFLMKLDPSGKLIWSASGIGGAVTVDGGENIYVAGSNDLGNFPTTANALQRTATYDFCATTGGLIPFVFPCVQQYIAKVSPDGTNLLFATYLTGTLGAAPRDIALGPDGSVYTVGGVNSIDYPVTAGALISTNPAKFNDTLCSCAVPSVSYPSSGFVSRLSADGTTLLYSTYLGGSQQDFASAIAVGTDGNMVVGGAAISPDFPGLPQQLDACRPGSSLLGGKQRDFLMQISADGSQIKSAQLIGGTNPGAGIACVTDAADSSFADTVSPGELITISGFGVGPATSSFASFDNPAMQLGGVSVMFDGIAAPLTVAGGTIVTAGVPFAIAGKQQTTLTLLHNGQPFDSRTLNIAAATPSMFVLPPNAKACDAPPAAQYGSFTGGSPPPVPMILNSDGTINACDNPATSASAVTVFLNGLGAGTPQVSALGGALMATELGNQFAIASVSVQIPAIDPPKSSAGANVIFVYLTVGGAFVRDYQNYDGIPLYVK